MIDGILLIDKQKDITSYQVIRDLKRILEKGQKIGHSGTLDPFATGLLIILLGKGTKLMNSFLSFRKQYEVKAEFGYATDTQDSTGKIINSKKVSLLTKEKIEEVISQKFLGEIAQIPPIFSAKKIQGRKAYEFARKGKKIEIPSKEIEIYEFKLTNMKWPFCTFEITCSSGTYIRTLIDDLGKSLDSFATAVELRRTNIGEYSVMNAYPSKKITSESRDEIYQKVLSLENISL